jgi:hypothetical protein
LQHDSGGNATSGGSGGLAHIAGSGYQASFTPGELDLLMLDWHIPSEGERQSSPAAAAVDLTHPVD